LLSLTELYVIFTIPQVGVIEDTENRERLAKLLRFHSSKSETDMVGLQEYVGRMKEGQKGIYYMVSVD
jgi:HSP90 family molecular chaperone